jgi:hypothetical protein
MPADEHQKLQQYQRRGRSGRSGRSFYQTSFDYGFKRDLFLGEAAPTAPVILKSLGFFAGCCAHVQAHCALP